MSAVLDEIPAASDFPDRETLTVIHNDVVKLIIVDDQLLRITNQQTYDAAAAKFQLVCEIERKIVAHHKPMKEKAHELHKTICTAENILLAPVKQDKQNLSRILGIWDTEQLELQRVEQARLDEIERLNAIEEQLAVAVAIESEGADAEEVNAVLSVPVQTYAVVAQPTYTRRQGVGSTQRWSAELVDIKKLCAAVASGEVSPNYVLPNLPALNKRAQADTTLFNVPGVKAVSSRTATNRGSKQ